VPLNSSLCLSKKKKEKKKKENSTRGINASLSLFFLLPSFFFPFDRRCAITHMKGEGSARMIKIAKLLDRKASETRKPDRCIYFRHAPRFAEIAAC